jgi:sugar lactone lactonase YvrE
VVYRANQGNSGFYFRTDRVDSAVSVHGFQAEIDPNKDAGGLYETGGRAWVVQPTPDQVRSYYKPGDWNEMTVAAYGRDVQVQVNGETSARLRNDPGRIEGYFGLQLHGGMDMDVEFKTVEILRSEAELPAAEAAVEDARPIVPEGAQVRKLAGGFNFTEGPAPGPEGKIYFSDIPNERIHAYDPATGEVGVFREDSGRANGLMFAPSGAIYACEGGNRRLTRQFGNVLSVLVEQVDGKRLNSPNDIALDGRGGLYFTDPRYGNRDDMELDVEAVYYLPRRGEARQVIADLVRPNGIILSLDGKTLYVVDNGAQTVWAYRVEEDGSVTKGRLFAEMEDGGGDGMTMDERGNVYCAGRSDVWIWSPQGELLAKIAVPEGPANCIFGGRGSKTLYITARTSLYAIDLNVGGAW